MVNICKSYACYTIRIMTQKCVLYSQYRQMYNVFKYTVTTNKYKSDPFVAKEESSILDNIKN